MSDKYGETWTELKAYGIEPGYNIYQIAEALRKYSAARQHAGDELAAAAHQLIQNAYPYVYLDTDNDEEPTHVVQTNDVGNLTAALTAWRTGA